MSVIKDSFLYLGGELVSKSIPFLLMPFLSRKLGVEGFGDMSYYQTLIALLVIIFGFSQEGAITRYYYFYGKRSLGLIVSTSYAYTMVTASIFLTASYYFQSTVLNIIIIVSALQSLFNTQLVLRQCQKLAMQYIFLQFISALLAGAITYVMLTLFYSNLVTLRFASLLVSYSISVLFACVLYFFSQKKRILYPRKKHMIALKYIFVFGFPLLLHQFSGYMKGQFDRVLIFNLFSSQDLGIYSAAFQISSVLSIALMAVNKACVPYFYAALKENEVDFNTIKKMLIASIIISPVPAVIATYIPERAWLFILGDAFKGVSDFIAPFLLGIGFTLPYFILVNYLFYSGGNKYITLCSLVSTVAYVLILYVTSHIGIMYVPLSLVISNAVIVPLLYYSCIIINKKRVL